MTDVVNVFKDDRFVGRLTSTDRGLVTFAYDESVLGDQRAVVSVRLPVRPKPYESRDVLPCFENLLPEGDLRRMLALATKRAPSDVVGMLGVFGGECAGALTLWTEGTGPADPPQYAPCDAAGLVAAFGSAAEVAGLLATIRRGRLSMSGAQDKLVLDRRPPRRTEGAASHDAAVPVYRFPVAGAPGTVLVKRDRGNFPGLVQAELVGMHLMAAAGVPTAVHGCCALDASVYETARFDRVPQEDGRVVRLHAEDGCQLTGRTSREKYAQSGGPGFQELAAAFRRFGTDAVTDIDMLCRWALANIAIGNRDAHAKNVSMLRGRDGAFRLAPAYDVVCTLAYPHLDEVFALRFGGALRLAELSRHTLRKAAREFGLTEARVAELADDVTRRVVAALPDALEYAEREAGAHPVLAIIGQVVRDVASATRERLLDTRGAGPAP